MNDEVDASRRGTPADRPGRMPRIRWTKPRLDDEPLARVAAVHDVPVRLSGTGVPADVRDAMDSVRERLVADAWRHLVDHVAAARGVAAGDTAGRAALHDELERVSGLRLTIFVHAGVRGGGTTGAVAGGSDTPPTAEARRLEPLSAPTDDPRASERGLVLTRDFHEAHVMPKITVVPNPLVRAVTWFQWPA